jgi:hypothetical protein
MRTVRFAGVADGDDALGRGGFEIGFFFLGGGKLGAEGGELGRDLLVGFGEFLFLRRGAFVGGRFEDVGDLLGGQRDGWGADGRGCRGGVEPQLAIS